MSAPSFTAASSAESAASKLPRIFAHASAFDDSGGVCARRSFTISSSVERILSASLRFVRS
jgi:hypothetical protein